MLYIILFAVGMLICIPIAHGLHDGFTDTPKYRSIYFSEPLEVQQEKPFYIEDQINAIYHQIEVNHNLINQYTESLTYTTKAEDVNTYHKKIADLEYKTARLEEKVIKLLEKWE